MPSRDDTMTLTAEILQKDLEALRKLETWGSSLFLGAIAVLGKQLIQWDKAANVAERVTLEPWAFVSPAAIGVVACVFLRVVNFRGHRASLDLRRMASESFPSMPISWGILGLLLALFPMALGYAVSWLLVHGNQARCEVIYPLCWGGAIVLLVGVACHIVIRWRSTKK